MRPKVNELCRRRGASVFARDRGVSSRDPARPSFPRSAHGFPEASNGRNRRSLRASEAGTPKLPRNQPITEAERWLPCPVSRGSIIVLTLALPAGGTARAQFGFFGGIPRSPAVSQLGLGYGTGTAWGTSSFDHGSFSGAGFGRLGGTSVFPLPGYGLSLGLRPQTTSSFQPLVNVVTSLPGWSGFVHRVHRRH
jgi:hypothetical protein